MNLAMLLATPVEGTHYLIDIIAGAVVALLAIKFTRTFTGRFGRRTSGSEFGSKAVRGWGRNALRL